MFAGAAKGPPTSIPLHTLQRGPIAGYFHRRRNTIAFLSAILRIANLKRLRSAFPPPKQRQFPTVAFTDREKSAQFRRL